MGCCASASSINAMIQNEAQPGQTVPVNQTQMQSEQQNQKACSIALPLLGDEGDKQAFQNNYSKGRNESEVLLINRSTAVIDLPPLLKSIPKQPRMLQKHVVEKQNDNLCGVQSDYTTTTVDLTECNCLLTLSGLENCKNQLAALKITNSELSNTDTKVFTQIYFMQLNSVELVNCNLSRIKFGAQPQLSHLNLSCNHISSLQGLKLLNLTHLNLCQNDVCEATELQAIRNMRITHINLSQNQVCLHFDLLKTLAAVLKECVEEVLFNKEIINLIRAMWSVEYQDPQVNIRIEDAGPPDKQFQQDKQISSNTQSTQNQQQQIVSQELVLEQMKTTDMFSGFEVEVGKIGGQCQDPQNQKSNSQLLQVQAANQQPFEAQNLNSSKQTVKESIQDAASNIMNQPDKYDNDVEKSTKSTKQGINLQNVQQNNSQDQIEVMQEQKSNQLEEMKTSDILDAFEDFEVEIGVSNEKSSQNKKKNMKKTSKLQQSKNVEQQLNEIQQLSQSMNSQLNSEVQENGKVVREERKNAEASGEAAVTEDAKE